MKHFRNKDGNIYCNGTNTPHDPSHEEVSQEELDQIKAEKESKMQEYLAKEAQKNMIDAVIKLLDDDEIADAVGGDTMMQFTAALAEFQTRGKVKLDRYPLAAQQIQEWTKQGKL